MRILIFSVVAVVVGTLGGLATTKYEMDSTSERFELRASAQTVFSREADGNPIAVIVGEESHEFEMIPKGGESTCTFTVRNDGDSVLRLQRHTVSCGLCVITDFRNASLAPGEEISFDVTLRARKPGALLDENIELRTNDPAREHITLNMTAFVTDIARVNVEGLSLGSISTEEDITGVFRIYGYFSEDLEIVSHKFTQPKSLKHFDLEYRKLAPGEFTEEKNAKAAYEMQVKIKKGMPIGPLQQNVQIVARCATEEGSSELAEIKLDVPVGGAVTGDISFLPVPGFNVERSVLSLGRVRRGEGKKKLLHLWVKGPHRHEAKLRIGSTDPEEILTATLGEPKPVKDGQILMYPLTVTVDKDAPPIDRLEGATTRPGEVVIKTSHPTIAELTLRVRFAVQ